MRKIKWLIFFFFIFITGCSIPFITGRTIVNSFVGYASWYGSEFHGKKTSSGEIYDMNKLTAAHRSLPFGTYVLVTNLKNGKSVMVKINDRGPFIKGRIIDLSYKAALKIGLVGTGITKVKIEVFQ